MTRSMKILILAALICLANNAIAGGILPDGSFRGTGHWTGPDGSSGEYQVEAVITGDVVESTYHYPEAQPGKDKHTVRITARDDGSIIVTDEQGKINGRGYCLEEECYYRIEIDGLIIEENIRFGNGVLIKFGSKSSTDFRIVWKETLKLDLS